MQDLLYTNIYVIVITATAILLKKLKICKCLIM